MNTENKLGEKLAVAENKIDTHTKILIDYGKKIENIQEAIANLKGLSSDIKNLTKSIVKLDTRLQSLEATNTDLLKQEVERIQGDKHKIVINIINLLLGAFIGSLLIKLGWH